MASEPHELDKPMPVLRLIDAPLTAEERAAFMAVCPNIERVVLNAELEPDSLSMKLGVAVFFDDGAKMAMRRGGCFSIEHRESLLRTAAVKLRDWHKAKTDG